MRPNRWAQAKWSCRCACSWWVRCPCSWEEEETECENVRQGQQTASTPFTSLMYVGQRQHPSTPPQWVQRRALGQRILLQTLVWRAWVVVWWVLLLARPRRVVTSQPLPSFREQPQNASADTLAETPLVLVFAGAVLAVTSPTASSSHGQPDLPNGLGFLTLPDRERAGTGRQVEMGLERRLGTVACIVTRCRL